jgi:hypothetical protein
MEEVSMAAAEGFSSPVDSSEEPHSDAEPTPGPAKDRASLSLVALRDVAIVSALLSLFAGAEALAVTSGLAIASLVATVDGFLVGAAVGALAHEWGHFAGARQAGGRAPLRPIRSFLPLYDYDYQGNDARTFLWMSLGGNLAHALVVIVLLLVLPLESWGTAALVSGAFGFAVFSSSVELPVIRKARAGASAIEALGVIPRDFVRHYLPRSVIAALVLFVLL